MEVSLRARIDRGSTLHEEVTWVVELDEVYFRRVTKPVDIIRSMFVDCG